MSFSKLARIGANYKNCKKPWKYKSSKNQNKIELKSNHDEFCLERNILKKETKENSIRDNTNQTNKERMKTVIEDSDESFLELTFDGVNEQSNKYSNYFI